MNTIVELRNHMEFAKRCFYNLDSGKYQIKTINNVNSANLGDGIFIALNRNLYALVKSVDGPIFIFIDMRFALNNINFEFHHEILKGNSYDGLCRFIFEVDKKEVINIIYEKPSEDWSFWDMDMDFFHWIVYFSHTPELIERWQG